MAKFNITQTTTVAELKSQFSQEIGGVLRIYEGRSEASEAATLVSLGATPKEWECRTSRTVGSFEKAFQDEINLKVKVYTRDNWVKVLDDITLETASKLPNGMTKAKMEAYVSNYATPNRKPKEEKCEIVNISADEYLAQLEAVENAKHDVEIFINAYQVVFQQQLEDEWDYESIDSFIDPSGVKMYVDDEEISENEVVKLFANSLTRTSSNFETKIGDEIYKIKQETLKLKVWFKIRIAGEFDINKLQLLRKKMVLTLPDENFDIEGVDLWNIVYDGVLYTCDDEAPTPQSRITIWWNRKYFTEEDIEEEVFEAEDDYIGLSPFSFNDCGSFCYPKLKKFGLLNKKEEFVLPAVYDYICNPIDINGAKCFIVKKESKSYLVNESGEILCDYGEVIFKNTSNPIDINGAKCFIVKKESKSYLVNESGEILCDYGEVNFINTKFAHDKNGTLFYRKDKEIKEAFPASVEYEKFKNVDLSKGLFALIKGDKMAFADAFNGKILTDFIFDSYYDYNESEGLICTRIDDKFGTINLKGEIVHQFKFSDSLDFKDGLAWAYDDADGKFIVDSQGHSLFPASDFDTVGWRGFFEVANEDREVALVSKEGKLLTPFQYVSIQDFSEGLAVALTKDYKFVYLDESGHVALKLDDNIKDADNFKNGLAIVRNQNKKYGFINKRGELVIDFLYDNAEIFDSNGYAVIGENERYGLIDALGNIIIKPLFKSLNRCEDTDFYIFQIQDKYGVIDCNNHIVVKAEYDEIRSYLYDGLFYVGKNE